MKLSKQDGLDYLNNALLWIKWQEYDSIFASQRQFRAHLDALEQLQKCKYELEEDIWREHASDKFGRHLKEVSRQFWCDFVEPVS